MVALLNPQSTNSAQGLVNTNLYSLAGQSWANCQSGSVQTSACIFNQVSSGTIAMPCNAAQTAADSATGCNILTNGDALAETTQANGTLGYNAGAGYNLATGLGSLNVASLVNQWNIGSGGAADFVLSADPAAIAVSTAGGSGNTVLSVLAVNGFNDTVNFTSSSCTGLPTGATCSFGTSQVSAGSSTTLTIMTSAMAVAPPSDPAARFRPVDARRVCFAFRLRIRVFGNNFATDGLRGKNRRWSTAAACAVFLLSVGIAACGGGSSSSSGGGGGGGGGGTTTTVVEPMSVTITGTSTSGKVARTTSVMLTAE